MNVAGVVVCFSMGLNVNNLCGSLPWSGVTVGVLVTPDGWRGLTMEGNTA